MQEDEESQFFNFQSRPGKVIEKDTDEANVEEAVINIVTTYNEKNSKINETANSIINQTFPYWKWTIINETNRNIKNLVNDNRIEICNKNKKEIIEESKCEFIFNINSGDVLDRTTLECSYWTLKTNITASWCYSNYVIDNKILENRIFLSEDEEKNNIVNKAYMIRKEKILEMLDKQDDWEIFKNLLKKGEFPVRMNFYGSWNTPKLITYNQENQVENSIKIQGINYPVGTNYYFNTYPFELEWNKEKKSDSTKKNLLFIFPWFRIGGADKFNYYLISNIDRSKYNITIITTEPCPYIERQKFEEYAEIFDLTTFLHKEYWAPFIHYIIKTRNIKLVMNSNSYYGYYAIPWLKSKFPEVIFTDYLHAVNWFWKNGEYPRDSTAIAKILDKTFVTSNNVKETMKTKMGRKHDNVEVVYIGVDSERFNEKNINIKNYPEITKYKEKYTNKKIILLCSRISKEKRPMLIVKTFEKMRKEREDIILFVVGDGELLEEMKKYAHENGLEEDIIFFGMKEDTRPFYKLANVLVIASAREGITLTAYEALSMSTPVVTANVGGQAELVNEDVGRVVENIDNKEEQINNINYSEEELNRYIKAIEEIIDSNEYDKLKENCRRAVEEKFSIKIMVEKMEIEFEKLIKNGTTVPLEISNNEELYKQYLVMHNEIDKRIYNSPVGGVIRK
ncbi:MAG: glycosyltransferase [Clostridia bacterium]|nr:glycosyltransferase [Clostridia bacterium]